MYEVNQPILNSTEERDLRHRDLLGQTAAYVVMAALNSVEAKGEVAKARKPYSEEAAPLKEEAKEALDAVLAAETIELVRVARTKYQDSKNDIANVKVREANDARLAALREHSKLLAQTHKVYWKAQVAMAQEFGFVSNGGEVKANAESGPVQPVPVEASPTPTPEGPTSNVEVLAPQA